MELTSTLVSVLIILATQFAKKFGISQKYATLALVILVSIGYTAFHQFLPVELKGNIIMFVSGTIGQSKVLYDVVSKK